MAEQQFYKHVNIAIDNEGFYWITPIVTTESFNFIAPPFFKTQVAHTDPQTIIDLAFIAMKYCRWRPYQEARTLYHSSMYKGLTGKGLTAFLKSKRAEVYFIDNSTTKRPECRTNEYRFYGSICKGVTTSYLQEISCCPLDASKEEMAELLQKELKKSYAATEEYMKQEAIKKRGKETSQREKTCQISETRPRGRIQEVIMGRFVRP